MLPVATSFNSKSHFRGALKGCGAAGRGFDQRRHVRIPLTLAGVNDLRILVWGGTSGTVRRLAARWSGEFVRFAVPETKAREIISRLDAVADGAAPLTTLDQIEFSAGSLRSIAKDDYLMILGIIASLRGDQEKSKALFSEAIEGFGYTSELCMNFTMVLLEMGCYGEAIRFAVDACGHTKDPAALRSLASVLGGHGMYQAYQDITGTIDTMTGESSQQEFAAAISGISEIGVSETDMFAGVEHCRRFLREHGYRRMATKFAYEVFPGEPPYLFVAFSIPGSVDDVYEIEKKLHASAAASGLKAFENGVLVAMTTPRGAPANASNLG